MQSDDYASAQELGAETVTTFESASASDDFHRSQTTEENPAFSADTIDEGNDLFTNQFEEHYFRDP